MGKIPWHTVLIVAKILIEVISNAVEQDKGSKE